MRNDRSRDRHAGPTGSGRSDCPEEGPMSDKLPLLYLARHGDTAWTESHQHTGRTDLPLNEHGKEHARLLGARLKGLVFARVFTSPLQRAARTCELAGFDRAEVDPDLLKWAYGEYEGVRTAEILAKRPGWELFRDGCPGGESPQDVAARADRFVAKVRQIGNDVLAFSSGHILRVIAARWLGLPASAGRYFFCSPAGLGVLGYEHSRDEPVLRLWNEGGLGS